MSLPITATAQPNEATPRRRGCFWAPAAPWMPQMNTATQRCTGQPATAMPRRCSCCWTRAPPWTPHKQTARQFCTAQLREATPRWCSCCWARAPPSAPVAIQLWLWQLSLAAPSWCGCCWARATQSTPAADAVSVGGNASLVLAAMLGKTEVVRLLLGASIDPQVALAAAVRRGHHDIAQLLRDAGATD